MVGQRIRFRFQGNRLTRRVVTDLLDPRRPVTARGRMESAAWQQTLAEASAKLLSDVLDPGGRHYLTFDCPATPE